MGDRQLEAAGAAEPLWLASLVKAEPRAPLVAPYMAYLLLLAAGDLFPVNLSWLAMSLHMGLVAWVICLFRRHYPTLGRAHWPIAVVGGLLAAWGWVAGQHFLSGKIVAGYDLGGRLLFYPGEASPYDPHTDFGDGAAFWVHVVLKITRACTVVPVVEELFWRGFILHAFVNWHRPEEVPWGRFSWLAMVGSALLSTMQHPDNWGVSIGCWLLFNALFYWTKSLRCLMIMHGVTNLALYVYVVRSGDWQFW